MAECDVCCGTGRYPIMDKHGSELYSIRCPECLGSGDDFGAAEERRAEESERQRNATVLRKYQQVMAEKRAWLAEQDK